MKLTLNILRLLIYIALSAGLIWVMNRAITWFLVWLVRLDTGWFIVVTFTIVTAIFGISMILFGAISAGLSRISPYKSIGGWIVIPLAIIYGLFHIYFLWVTFDLGYTKGIFTAIIGTGLIYYTTFSFAICISAKNTKGVANM